MSHVFPTEQALNKRRHSYYTLEMPDGKVHGPWLGPIRVVDEGFTLRKAHRDFISGNDYYVKKVLVQGITLRYVLARINSVSKAIVFRR